MDEQKFLGYFDIYRDAIYRYCVALLKNEHDAQDCTQDVFIKLYHQKIDDSDYVRNWLYKVAHNECMSLYRKPWKRIVYDEALITQLSVRDETKETSILLQCPVKYREVLFLYYYEGYNQQEIAALLNLSLSNVKKRMTRGRDYLRDHLGKEGDPHV